MECMRLLNMCEELETDLYDRKNPGGAGISAFAAAYLAFVPVTYVEFPPSSRSPYTDR